MEIGHQIKALRLRHGVSQQTMARHFGITPQAISKWERGAATPDIGLLPALSAYFGVAVCHFRQYPHGSHPEYALGRAVSGQRRCKRQPGVPSAQGRAGAGKRTAHELLADMENHIAREHRQRAADYAKEALRRDSTVRNAHSELVQAMGGRSGDWNKYSHYQLVDDYRLERKLTGKSE